MTPIRLHGSTFLRGLHAAFAAACFVLAGCGGSADAPPPPEPSEEGVAPPVITQQPADRSVTAGQPASFTVAATGAAPLAYQWQRGGADIAGATSTTYSVPATVLGDSGAVLRAVVSNAGGSVTSQNATLTVTQSAPVLTITQQPASLSVVAGSQASFVVAGTCSSGTLTVQWQRSQGGSAFADVAGATALTYSLNATSGDSGAIFRAALACSGQSGATSQTATLTVSAPSGGATIAALPIVGLRSHADINSLTAMDGMPDGSTVLVASSRIKRLSADLSSIVTIAGGPSFGAVDGAAADARFLQPSGLAHDAAGNIYIADTGNHTIRRLATDGTVSTIAGRAGSSGSIDGTGAAARFSSPRGIFMAPDGDLYVADTNNDRIRRVTLAGVVTTYAGSSQGYLDSATPLAAQFRTPQKVVVAANGDVIVSDTGNNRMRRVLRAGSGGGAVQTLAGTGGIAQFPYADGIGTAANMGSPTGMTLSGNVVVVRTSPGHLRRVDLATRAVTRLTGRTSGGDGFWDGPAALSSIEDSGDVTTTANGAFLMVDTADKIRHVDATGYVRTIAHAVGSGLDPATTGVIAQLPFDFATGNGNTQDVAIAADPSGNLIVAEKGAKLVRRIDTAGAVTQIAGLYGSEDGSFSSRDGTGSEAAFSAVGKGLAVDAAGVIWATDGSCLRRIDTANTVTTRAGNCEGGGTTDGPGASALFFAMDDLALGSGGNIFVAESFSKTIRRVDAAGVVSTYAGVASQAGTADGPIAAARFESPTGLGVGPDGAVYVVDNKHLRRIAPDGQSVSTLAAAGSQVRRLVVDAAGTVYYLTMASDLYMLPAGASSPTLLVPGGGIVVLGGPPTARLAIASKLALVGPKTLVVLCYQQLVVVNLP
jgi:sugar lactone lactonase YvrE